MLCAKATGVLVILGILSVPGSMTSWQRAPIPTAPSTHEFAFTRFFGRYGQAVAVDKNGNVYVTGRTPDVPDFTTEVRSQKKYGGGQDDAFVAKYSSDGQRLIYATYLGGGAVDMGEDIAVDDSGNAYVTGTTYSRNFPTTDAAVQTRFGGGDRDCFVVKLSADGSTLLYSTLLGGEKQDRCSAIDIDAGGNAYVTGSTNSKEFAVSNTANSRVPGNDWDVFTAKLNAEGRNLAYVLRFGGSAGSEPGDGQSGGEFGTGIAVDKTGSAFVVGQTDSTDFPISEDAQPRFEKGGISFIVRIHASGSGLMSGAYLGNGGRVAAVALDMAGAPHVTGLFSNDAGSATGSQRFMAKLTPELHRVVYSSPLLYSANNGVADSPSDIAVDGLGRVYVVGTAARPTAFPKRNPLQESFPGIQDAFLIVLDASGTVLLSSTIGGGALDYGEGVAVDNSGSVYIAGTTLGGDSTIFPGGKTLGITRYGAFVSKIVPRSAQLGPPRPGR